MDAVAGYALLALALPVGFAISLVYFERERRTWRAARRRLARTPRVPLAELTEGAIARVVGRTAVLGEVLAVPVTGRACLHDSVTIYEMKARGMAVCVHEEVATAFVLDDETGTQAADGHQRPPFDHEVETDAATVLRPVAAACKCSQPLARAMAPSVK